MNIAVILASGVGKRMKVGKNKVLLRLAGKPILYYTISAFQKLPEIKEIILFARQDEISPCIKGANKHGACVVAHPAKDTIKEVDEKGLVMITLDRKTLWNMQT